MKYFDVRGFAAPVRHPKKISAAGMGTTSFWSGSNAGLDRCIRTAVTEYGVTVLDTAEMYGGGRCETELGKTVGSLDRESLFIVDKILPSNVQKKVFRRRLEESLKRLKTDYIDLYLLHWRENADLQLMVDEMEAARTDGLISAWGVSNFDVNDMRDLLDCENGRNCFCNQIYYSVYERGTEFDLLPLLKQEHILPMAYSSLGSGFAAHPDIRREHRIMDACREAGIVPEAFMLKFVAEHGVQALFQTSSLQHLRDDLKEVPDRVYAEILPLFEEAFPAPQKAKPLVKM